MTAITLHRYYRLDVQLDLFGGPGASSANEAA
jgi:hypothetical protein